MAAMTDAVQAVIDKQLAGLKQLDGDVFEYVSGMLLDIDTHNCDAETLQDMVAPFLLSSGYTDDEDTAAAKVGELAAALQAATQTSANSAALKPDDDGVQHERPLLLEKVVRMGDREDVADKDLDFMWGKDKIRKQYNQVKDWDQHVSKKDMRKAEREQEKFLAELEQLTGGADDDGEDNISMMVSNAINVHPVPTTACVRTYV